MDSRFRLVFIHGYTASHQADFYPSIVPLLEERGWEYAIPDLPGGTQPHAQEWLEVLHATVLQDSKPLVLVGHSLGTRTALLYLEKYQPEIKLLLLIGAFANRPENALRRGGIAYPDFFTHKINLEKIKPLIKKSVVMHSKDDSSIPFEQAVEVATELEAELLTYTNRDHFSKPENAIEIMKVLAERLG